MQLSAYVVDLVCFRLPVRDYCFPWLGAFVERYHGGAEPSLRTEHEARGQGFRERRGYWRPPCPSQGAASLPRVAQGRCRHQSRPGSCAGLNPGIGGIPWLRRRIGDCNLSLRISGALNFGSACRQIRPRSRSRRFLAAGSGREILHDGRGPGAMHVQWLRSGAPTGVTDAVPPGGIFPACEQIGEPGVDAECFYAQTEPWGNYLSVEQNASAVQQEFSRLEQAGFVRRFSSWADVQQQLGRVVVSKMACVISQRADGSTKHRLIVDLRRSGANSLVQLGERIVLPRLWDAVVDTLHLARRAKGEDGLEMMVMDWADAYHSISVKDQDIPFQVVRGPSGDYFAYLTLPFCGGAAPLIWGRAGAWLGRSGSSLFHPDEARIEVYVDDPWSCFSGAENTHPHLKQSLGGGSSL